MPQVDAPASQPGDLNQLEQQLREAVSVSKAAGSAGKKPENNGDMNGDEAGALPDKFKGKTPAEIAEMYQELHSAYGRMANDLGQQRKLTDRLLDLKRTDDLARSTPPAPQIKSEDVLENPVQAIEAVVAPRIKAERDALEQRLNHLEAGLAQTAFVNKHPDYQDIANNPDFVKWLQASPYRQRVAQQALQGDWSAADEIVSEYKNTAKSRAKADDNGSRIEEARKAGLESSTQANGSSGGGKVYRRADLIRLKIEKPHVYSDPAFQQEILKAYAEKRVR